MILEQPPWSGESPNLLSAPWIVLKRAILVLVAVGMNTLAHAEAVSPLVINAGGADRQFTAQESAGPPRQRDTVTFKAIFTAAR